MKVAVLAIANIVALIAGACAPGIDQTPSGNGTGGVGNGDTGGMDAVGGVSGSALSTGGELSCSDDPDCDPRPPRPPCDLYADSFGNVETDDAQNLGGAGSLTVCVRPIK